MRACGGHWRLRLDDLDTFRSEPGAEASILTTLEAHGLHWDGPLTRQSEQLERYTTALEQLAEAGLTFACKCSRRSLKGLGPYPGTCRALHLPDNDTALRVLVGDARIHFHDTVRGDIGESLANSVGDFVIRRRDGLIAYQLATAVDDGAADITHVLRGSDLLSNTARQIYLMQLLKLQVPQYAHVPTLLGADGHKLSKQTHAEPVRAEAASANLAQVMRMLGLSPPAQAHAWQADELVAWAVDHWQIEAVPQHDLTFHPQA